MSVDFETRARQAGAGVRAAVAEADLQLATPPTRRPAPVRRQPVAHLGWALSGAALAAALLWLAAGGCIGEPPEPERGGVAFRGERLRRLDRVADLFGGPLQPLSPAAALDQIRDVNSRLIDDPWRRKDALGNAGAVVELPPQPAPIIVGDLHARVDNLLTVLTENAFLDALDRAA